MDTVSETAPRTFAQMLAEGAGGLCTALTIG
jgi:hypothetical protein